MSEKKFDEAPEVEDIAKDLIEKYHRHLIDFDVKVRYVFLNSTAKSKGREVWGSCKKISGLNSFLEGGDSDEEPFFVINISRPVWDALPPDKRIAMVDHYLCQAWAEVKQAKDEADADVDAEIEQDNPVKLSIKPYDVEEYSCIIRRHGLWREEVEEFMEEALAAKEKAKEEKGD